MLFLLISKDVSVSPDWHCLFWVTGMLYSCTYITPNFFFVYSLERDRKETFSLRKKLTFNPKAKTHKFNTFAQKPNKINFGFWQKIFSLGGLGFLTQKNQKLLMQENTVHKNVHLISNPLFQAITVLMTFLDQLIYSLKRTHNIRKTPKVHHYYDRLIQR